MFCHSFCLQEGDYREAETLDLDAAALFKYRNGKRINLIDGRGLLGSEHFDEVLRCAMGEQPLGMIFRKDDKPELRDKLQKKIPLLKNTYVHLTLLVISAWDSLKSETQQSKRANLFQLYKLLARKGIPRMVVVTQVDRVETTATFDVYDREKWANELGLNSDDVFFSRSYHRASKDKYPQVDDLTGRLLLGIISHAEPALRFVPPSRMTKVLRYCCKGSLFCWNVIKQKLALVLLIIVVLNVCWKMLLL